MSRSSAESAPNPCQRGAANLKARCAHILRRLYHLGIAVAAGLLLSACDSPDTSSPSIVVDRQVSLTGVDGRPNAVVKIPDGGFVVVGEAGTAWAVGTTSEGEVKWKYSEAFDKTYSNPAQSAFVGAVSLANGNVLLCGRKLTKEAYTGLIVIADHDGHVVDRREPLINGSHEFQSRFGGCTPWNDGVALIGSGSDGRTGVFWLMKLDKKGALMWERAIPESVGASFSVAAEESLVVSGSTVQEATLVRFNQQGQAVNRRLIPGPINSARFLRQIGPSAVFAQLISYDDEIRIYTLNEQLQDDKKPVRTGAIFIEQGCGYVLSDGSSALFGYGSVSGGYRAAVAHVNQPGKRDQIHFFAVPNRGDASFTVADAVPVSANQFVTVRDLAASAEHSIVLSWITFK